MLRPLFHQGGLDDAWAPRSVAVPIPHRIAVWQFFQRRSVTEKNQYAANTIDTRIQETAKNKIYIDVGSYRWRRGSDEAQKVHAGNSF